MSQLQGGAFRCEHVTASAPLEVKCVLAGRGVGNAKRSDPQLFKDPQTELRTRANFHSTPVLSDRFKMRIVVRFLVKSE